MVNSQKLQSFQVSHTPEKHLESGGKYFKKNVKFLFVFCGFCKFQFAVRIKGRGGFKLIVHNDFPIVKSTDAEIVMESKVKIFLRIFLGNTLKNCVHV